MTGRFGAQRYYLSDARWRAVFEELVPRSRAFFAVVATIGENFVWELAQLRKGGHPLPPTMKIEDSHAELLWPAVTDDDEPCKFVRAKIRAIARTVQGTKQPPVR